MPIEDILIDNLKFDETRLSFELLDKDEAKNMDEFFGPHRGFNFRTRAGVTFQPERQTLTRLVILVGV
jgi:hypothetical protein